MVVQRILLEGEKQNRRDGWVAPFLVWAIYENSAETREYAPRQDQPLLAGDAFDGKVSMEFIRIFRTSSGDVNFLIAVTSNIIMAQRCHNVFQCSHFRTGNSERPKKSTNGHLKKVLNGI
jgi:hypothetical protein